MSSSIPKGSFSKAPSLRQLINSGQRSFEELRPLLERAGKFREWLAGKSPDADLIKAYHREVIQGSWAEKLPARALRFLLFNGAGLALDALGGGGIGTLARLALSAADAFVLDKLARVGGRISSSRVR
jgi:hypothetical protein